MVTTTSTHSEQTASSISDNTTLQKRHSAPSHLDSRTKILLPEKTSSRKMVDREETPVNAPTGVPCEVTNVSEKNETGNKSTKPHPSPEITLDENVNQYIDKKLGKESPKVEEAEKRCTLDHVISQENNKIVTTSSTEEESGTTSSFLSGNELQWTEKKTSRVGYEYQALHLPEAGSYLNVQGDDFDQLEQLLLADQIWDPLKATCKGINDFVHFNCPPNKKEAALELLHQRDYDDTLFAAEIDRLHVLDGSDWSLSEHENFRRLMQTTRHNVYSVSKSMGKSINNCLTVYYKIINVRETRSTKKKFSGLTPMEEVNELKDIGRSMRIKNRNQRKRNFSSENCDSDEEDNSKSENRKRIKASSASDKIKDPSVNLSPSSNKDGPVHQTKSKLKSGGSPLKQNLVKRTSPRKVKKAPKRLTDEHAKEQEEKTRLLKAKPGDQRKSVDMNQNDKILLPPENSQTSTRVQRAAKKQALKILSRNSIARKIQVSTEINKGDISSKEMCSMKKTNTEGRRIVTLKRNSLTQDKGKKGKNIRSVPESEAHKTKRPATRSYKAQLSADDSSDDAWEESEHSDPSNHNANSHVKNGDEHFDDDPWDMRYAALVQFKEKHGHCLVPKVYPENRQLSYWVFRQRGLYSNKNKKNGSGSLTDERIKKLKDIGFVFKAKHSEEQNRVDAARRKPQLDAKWNKFFQEFCSYKEKTGSCLIPKVFEENQPLSSWAFTQRHQMKRRKDGKYNLLNEERIKKLNDIGFVWHAKKNKEWQEADRVRKRATVEIMWQNHYKSLIEFKKKHGHTRVPKVYRQNQALSTWVFRQRAHYRRRTQGEEHVMTDARLELLEKIDFQFRVRK